jgi:hypothetical protein
VVESTMAKYFLRGISIALCCISLFSGFSVPMYAEAQRVVQYNVADLLPRAEINITPRSGTFQEGSTFEVPIFINTKTNNINAVELNIKFDPSRLSVIHPSGGKSIIGLWVEPPSYNNTKGTARIVGAIPGGIVTNSGLIVTITFQAKVTGQAIVEIMNNSSVLLNDGMGSPVAYEANRGVYTIVAKPPQGVIVYSDTHPFQDHWYNNRNPVLAWNKDPGVNGFSFLLDDKPNTVPENIVSGSSTVMAYENAKDGLSYFHIKALKNKAWGASTDYLVRIDTTPPAEFKPTVDYLSASTINRFLVSFFTTDSLSGIDHYEVGVIDKAKPVTESPVFVQTDSPYQIPFEAISNARVVVRAFDKAGNVRDGSIDVTVPFLPWKYVVDHATNILLGILALILFLILFHYLIGHRIIRRIRKAFTIIEHEESLEHEKQEEKPKQRYQEYKREVVTPAPVKLEVRRQEPVKTVEPSIEPLRTREKDEIQITKTPETPESFKIQSEVVNRIPPEHLL